MTTTECESIDVADGDPPLFTNAAKAVRFAVTRMGSPSRPVMNRMSDASLPDTGLAGLDGAAQAGIIMSVLHELGIVYEAALVAASAPRMLNCACRRPCCSGRAFNATWNAAINTLCDEMVIMKLRGGGLLVTAKGPVAAYALLTNEAVSQVDCEHAIKLGAVLKIYGSNLTLVKISAETGKHPDTVGKYHQAIHRWLKGATAGRHSEGVEGVEPKAWKEAETRLRDLGIVG